MIAPIGDHRSMPQTALITGASVGIGYELAKQFARGGYNLLLVARDEERLKAVCEEAKRMAVQADYIARDLSQPDGPIAFPPAAIPGPPPADCPRLEGCSPQ